MFRQNADLFFQHVHHTEPDSTTLIGSFPEDDPKHVVYEMQIFEDTEYGVEGSTTYVVIDMNSSNMMIRECDEEEKERILELKTDNSNTEDESDVIT